MLYIKQIIHAVLISNSCYSQYLLNDGFIQRVQNNKENPSNFKGDQIKRRTESLGRSQKLQIYLDDRKINDGATREKPYRKFDLKEFEKYKNEAFEENLSQTVDGTTFERYMKEVKENTSPLLNEQKSKQCRENVIQSIVNASDIKDECEGFRRAFDESCSMITGSRHNNHRLLSTNPETIHPIKKIMTVISNHIFSSGEEHRNARKLQEASDDTNNRHRELPQLSLPTNQHVDYKMITKSLLLQDDENNNGQKELQQLSLPTDQHDDYKMVTKSLLLQDDENNKRLLGRNVVVFHNEKQKKKQMSRAEQVIKKLVLQSQANEAITSESDVNDNKKCCASILTVYHEYCEYKEEEGLDDGLLFGIVIIVVCSFLVKSLIRYFKIKWLPEAAGCIIVGSKFSEPNHFVIFVLMLLLFF